MTDKKRIDYEVPSPGMHDMMTTQQVRAMLLKEPQPYFYGGVTYEIVTKHLAAGVYRVSLKEWRANE